MSNQITYYFYYYYYYYYDSITKCFMATIWNNPC